MIFVHSEAGTSYSLRKSDADKTFSLPSTGRDMFLPNSRNLLGLEFGQNERSDEIPPILRMAEIVRSTLMKRTAK